jgi:tRNA A-37 threonylcarbamoyl transferase component Bud32
MCRRCSVLIYQAIEGSENAEDAYANATLSQRVVLVTGLMQTLAAHHQAGLLQTDLYLKNFLIHGDTLYTIDGDAIRQPKRLSHMQALRNVAILLSNIDVIELEQHLPIWMQAYGEVRQWQTQPNLKQLKAMIDRARQRILTDYADKKVFRTCTDVQVNQTQAQFAAYAKAFFEVVTPLSAAGLDALLNTSKPLKNGNTCTVGLAELQGKPVVIKRYNIKTIWHGLSRAFRTSRAAISWANAHRLQLLKMPTPTPVALLETYRFARFGVRLRGRAYFVSAYADLPDVAAYFAQTTDKASRAEAVKQLTMLLYRLYLLKLSHGDMKASNIKMQDTTPMLIDLDSMQQHRWAYFAQQAHARDLRRFMQNWKHDTSLYNAFIKSFKVVYADHTPLQQANILSD